MIFKADLFLTIFARIANTGFGAISVITIASVYGELGLGVFALLRTLPTVLLVFTEFGFSHAYSYLINNKKYSPNNTLSSGMYSALFVSVLQIMIWLVFGQLINSSFNMGLSLLPLYFISLLAPLLVLEIHVINLLRAIGKIKQANFVLTLVELLIACFATALYYMGINKLDYLCYLLVAAHTIVVLLSFSYLFIHGLLSTPKYHPLILKESLKFGIKSQLGNAFQILNYRLDHMIIGFIVGPKLLGIYFVATKAAEFFRFFSLSIVFVVEPIIAKANYCDAVDAIKRYYLPVFLVNLCFIVLGVYIGPILIPMIFDQWSENSIIPFYILMFGLAFVGSNGLIGAYNLGQGKPELNTIAIGVTLLVTILFNIILIPIFGVIGAATASTIAYICSAIAFLGLFIRDRKYHALETGLKTNESFQ